LTRDKLIRSQFSITRKGEITTLSSPVLAAVDPRTPDARPPTATGRANLEASSPAPWAEVAPGAPGKRKTSGFSRCTPCRSQSLELFPLPLKHRACPFEPRFALARQLWPAIRRWLIWADDGTYIAILLAQLTDCILTFPAVGKQTPCHVNRPSADSLEGKTRQSATAGCVANLGASTG
jgi:hypothetical protein